MPFFPSYAREKLYLSGANLGNDGREMILQLGGPLLISVGTMEQLRGVGTEQPDVTVRRGPVPFARNKSYNFPGLYFLRINSTIALEINLRYQ